MPFFDLGNFIRAAQMLLQGRDIYLLPDVYYPLPVYLIFIPLAGLPLPVACAVWSAIEILILVAILRRRALAVILFMPVFLTFLMGQVVMPMLGLFALLRQGKFGGMALGLLVLKPQLVIFVVPWMLWQWWKNNRRQLVWFALTVALWGMAAFIVQPNWLERWLAVSGRRLRAPISPSLWGLLSFLPIQVWVTIVGLATLGIFIWVWHKNDFDLIAASGFLVNPLSISYDLTLLTVLLRDTRAWLVLMLISWLSFALSAFWLNEGVYVLTTLAVVVMLVQQKRRIIEQARFGGRE